MAIEWQPIETAPRDGTKVDLWIRNVGWSGYRVTDCFWGCVGSGAVLRPFTGQENGWYYQVPGERIMIDKTPTHWMLVEPPHLDDKARPGEIWEKYANRYGYAGR
jgi:hypothetical protein